MYILIQKGEFDEVFRGTKALTAGMLESVKLLFSNDLIGPMKMTSETEFTDELLSYIVVHTYTIIGCSQRSAFLQPLYIMAHDPAKLAVSMVFPVF